MWQKYIPNSASFVVLKLVLNWLHNVCLNNYSAAGNSINQLKIVKNPSKKFLGYTLKSVCREVQKFGRIYISFMEEMGMSTPQMKGFWCSLKAKLTQYFANGFTLPCLLVSSLFGLQIKSLFFFCKLTVYLFGLISIQSAPYVDILLGQP